MTEPVTTDAAEDRLVETIPEETRTRVDWLILLGGPALWISHFMLVYLAAEAACTPTNPEQWPLLDDGALRAVTVVATVTAVIACAGLALLARRRARPTHHARYVADLAGAGTLTAVGAAAGIVAVGVPALSLSLLC